MPNGVSPTGKFEGLPNAEMSEMVVELGIVEDIGPESGADQFGVDSSVVDVRVGTNLHICSLR
jgi:hypothetical protein